MKNCTPLHAIVARITFRSHNVQNTSFSDHFRKLGCRKSARRCGTKHVSKSKCTKHLSSGPLLEIYMSKTCTLLWREAHFQVKIPKAPHARTTFEGSDVVLRGRRTGFCTLPKVSKAWGFCSIFKNDGRRGVKKICKDEFRVAGTVQEACSSEMLGGQGADFLRGVEFWSIRSSGLLRWFCVTDAALRMTWHDFSWQAQHFTQMECKNRKTHWHEAVSFALNFLFLKEVSQNCFVFDVVKFKNWGSLGELLRFWCCQVQKLRKSRRIASFFKLADR